LFGSFWGFQLSAVARSEFHLRVLEFYLILLGAALRNPGKLRETVMEIEVEVEINNQCGRLQK